MNRKQRRIQARSKSITRKAGLTYVTVAGVIGGSIGISSPAQAKLPDPQNYVATDCDSLKSSLSGPGGTTGLVATGGTLTADFSGTCDFAEGYVFEYASTITGPDNGGLTLLFEDTTNFGFAAYDVFNVRNLNFKTESEPQIAYFIAGLDVPISDWIQTNDVTVSNSTFSNATVSSAIYAEGNLTVSDSSFNQLTSGDSGAAITADDSNATLDITNSTFTSNRSSGSGGAISTNSETKVANSTFDLNRSTSGSGGAISGYSVTVTNSTFFDNGADSDGGALLSSNLDVNNSTFVDNGAFNASAIWSEGGIISNSTFWGNSARNPASVDVYFNYERGYLFANIFADEAPYFSNLINDLGANLYTDAPFVATSVGSTNTEEGSSKLIDFDDLKLSALALNTTGLINTGKTKTVAIGAGSIARDYYSATSAGINPTGLNIPEGSPAFDSRLATLDQRGVARPTGTRIDVGAFEYGEDPVVALVETPAVVTKATIAAQKIKFAPGSSKLSSASKKKLRTLAAEIQAKGLKTVNLEGYTATLTKAAPSGKALRVKLSKARATAVEKYLKQQFKKSGYSVTFTKSPKGAANRVKSNQTEKGRADNRRVEITIN